MEIPPEIKNQFVSTIAFALKSNVHEKGIAEYSPKYYRAKTLFEIGVKNVLLSIF